MTLIYCQFKIVFRQWNRTNVFLGGRNIEERTNIYFAGSIRDGRKDVELYSRIIGRLKRYGDVLTEHVDDYSLSVECQKQLPDRYICQRDLQWLRSSQLVVAEVAVPSLGVGYEIAAAVECKIPVIALFRTTEGTQLSAMDQGIRWDFCLRLLGYRRCSLKPRLHYGGRLMEKNVTYSLINVLRNIRDNGSPVVTRGKEQVEVLSQLLRIKSPLERVIVTPHRNNSIFALIAETFWVLGGRNDLGYLTHYLPRASDFSDDGKTWRAAYGPRLRNWYGVDQFQQVASLLRADPNTKRAVTAAMPVATQRQGDCDPPGAEGSGRSPPARRYKAGRGRPGSPECLEAAFVRHHSEVHVYASGSHLSVHKRPIQSMDRAE